jgi:hypothetical protein
MSREIDPVCWNRLPGVNPTSQVRVLVAVLESRKAVPTQQLVSAQFAGRIFMKSIRVWPVIGTFSLLLALAMSGAAQNPIIDWDQIAATTIITNGATAANVTGTAPGAITPGGSSIYLAFVHLAMYNAVEAIDGRYQPYLFALTAPRSASKQAAAIAAAHRILVNYFPDQTTALDAQYANSLAAIPDGKRKNEGFAVGEATAAILIALRANDGRGANVPYSFPAMPEPGVWIPTPPAFLAPQTPWVGQMKPLTMTSPSQFLPGVGPSDLGGRQWVHDYNETKTLGAFNSSARTPQQTEIGLFWTDHGGQQYSRALRQLATERHLNLVQSSRLFAMVFTAYADAFIGCMNAKYTFSFWRPVTAIHNGDIDGNPDTIADPNWLPLGTTPNHPEYPAAHGCVTGAVARALDHFLQGKKFHFTVTSTVTNTTHVFESPKELEDEVFHARIYAGFHYRHSLVQSFRLGHGAAAHVLRTNFNPLN